MNLTISEIRELISVLQGQLLGTTGADRVSILNQIGALQDELTLLTFA